MNGKLIYSAEYWFGGEPSSLNKRRAKITISPGNAPGAPPAYVVAADHSPAGPSSPDSVFLAGGQKLAVEAWSDLSGIRVSDAGGNGKFFEAPAAHMGPAAFDGHTIWFARRILDSDAYSAAGAIVEFDPGSHKYSVHELPEIGSLSGTAILADGNNIWLGLAGRPEVEGTNPGLLRYNKSTGTVLKYAVDDVINTINRMGDTIYCGTDDGLYTIRGSVVSKYRFEPDATGKLVMITRPGSFHPMTVIHK